MNYIKKLITRTKDRKKYNRTGDTPTRLGIKNKEVNNANNRWSDKDTMTILKMMNININQKKIAEHLGRTKYSISARVYYLKNKRLYK